MNADVIVIGGGPAGCATAIHLAQHGWKVLIVDKATVPRDKVCGEGIMPHGVAELETLGLRKGIVHAGAIPFGGITYRYEDHHAEGLFPSVRGFDHGLAIRRCTLDPFFQSAARATPGVSLQPGVEVLDLCVESHQVTLETSVGQLVAQAIVGADGLNSRVRHKLGLQSKARGRPRFGARFHLRLPDTVPSPSTVEVHLGRGCEYYITPVGPHLINLAFLLEKSESKKLGGDLQGGLWDLAHQCPSLHKWLRGAELVSTPGLCGPLRQTTSDMVADRALLVGDAAGFLDSITGEGLSVAFTAARIASNVLNDALPNGASCALLRPYQEQLTEHFKLPLQLTELILWWVQRPLLRGYVIDNLAKNPDVFQTLLAILAGETRIDKVQWADLRKLAFRY